MVVEHSGNYCMKEKIALFVAVCSVSEFEWVNPESATCNP